MSQHDRVIMAANLRDLFIEKTSKAQKLQAIQNEKTKVMLSSQNAIECLHGIRSLVESSATI